MGGLGWWLWGCRLVYGITGKGGKRALEDECAWVWISRWVWILNSRVGFSLSTS